MTLILVHTAHPQAIRHRGDGFGRLLSPRQCARAADTAAAGIPWAADNDLTRWLDATWGRIDCLFIGGSTEYKLGSHAEALVREAKNRGLWVHMGRVNSQSRFAYARAIGCDSVDGSSFSRWRDRWLPEALKWHRAHLQLRLPMLLNGPGGA